MKPQLIIFDLDGTLIDSRADLATGINHMRTHFGMEPLPLDTISGYVGDGVRKLVERSLQGANVDWAEALQVNRDHYYAHLTERTSLYPGVEAGLRDLKNAGHTLGMLTNKPGDPSRVIMQHFGLSDIFCQIIGGGDVPNLKPEADGVDVLLEISGIDRADAWMVGDHHTDLAVAENAGIRSALVEYGFGSSGAYVPTVSFDSFPELVEYFRGG